MQEDSFHIQRKVTFFLETFEIFRNAERVAVVRGGNCGGTAFRFQASGRHAVSVWVCKGRPLLLSGLKIQPVQEALTLQILSLNVEFARERYKLYA